MSNIEIAVSSIPSYEQFSCDSDHFDFPFQRDKCPTDIDLYQLVFLAVILELIQVVILTIVMSLLGEIKTSHD